MFIANLMASVLALAMVGASTASVSEFENNAACTAEYTSFVSMPKKAHYDPDGDYGTTANTIYNYSSCSLKFKYGYDASSPSYLDVGSGESVAFNFSGSRAFFLSVDGETYYLRGYANGNVFTAYGKDSEIIASADYGSGSTNGDGYLPVSDLSGKYVWLFDADVIQIEVSCEYACLTSSAWDNNFQNSKKLVQFLGGNYTSHSSFVVVLGQTDFSAFALYTDFDFTTFTYSYGNHGVGVGLDYTGIGAGDYSVSVVLFNPSSGVDFVGDIAEGLTGGIVPVAEGIGNGLQSLVQDIFLNAAHDGLSVFGIVTICFAGLALALGLSRWVLNFVDTLGARDR